MNNDRPKPEFLAEVPFSLTARVAIQLGRESISNSIVAVLEMVKNAYDADANTADVRFGHLRSPNAVMSIEDDGIGMSEAQLRRGWLVIGTQTKRRAPHSKNKKRVQTGEKGLGRLGLDRLCAKTTLRSFTKTASNGLELRIKWDAYERLSHSNLEKITHSLYRIDKEIRDPISGDARTYQNGTQVVLSGLKDKWDREQVEDLRAELTLLISPFSGLNDFRIRLTAQGLWPELEGEIGSSQILDAAEWSVQAEIIPDPQGSIKISMTSPRTDRVFNLGPTPWAKVFQGRGELARCGPLRLLFYFFPREKTELKNLSFTRSQIDSFLDSNQGIRIYRDNFRVKPYGNPNGEGDWLNLSYRRIQSPAGVRDDVGTWRVGYNQIVGAVFISRMLNPLLIDQTNREGIVEGDAYHDLRLFARRAIEFFEIKRQEFERAAALVDQFEAAKQRAESASKESENAVQELRKSVNSVKGFLTSTKRGREKTQAQQIGGLLVEAVNQVASSLQKSRSAQRRLETAAKEQAARLQRQKDTLGNLASLGILTASFGHETLGSANLVRNNAALLKINLAESINSIDSDLFEKMNGELRIVLEHSDRIETFAKFTISNIKRDKRRRKPLRLLKLTKYIFSQFAKALDDKGITPDLVDLNEVPAIHAFEIDWESILINLISNAVWALEDTPRALRKIKVRLKSKGNRITLSFADSGRGLEEGTRDSIFLPTFSTKRNAKGDVIGTGMGLAIVKSFVEDYPEGTLSVESPGELGGAQFNITVSVNGSRRAIGP